MSETSFLTFLKMNSFVIKINIIIIIDVNGNEFGVIEKELGYKNGSKIKVELREEKQEVSYKKGEA